VYYFFLAVVVRCKITATTVWALLFMVSAFFTHNCCCSLDRFSRVRGMLPHLPRLYSPVLH